MVQKNAYENATKIQNSDNTETYEDPVYGFSSKLIWAYRFTGVLFAVKFVSAMV